MPQARDAKVIHSLVIKEKRATFLPSPGLEAFRPNTQTEFENLFLAGDWTATGYPATIEGAIMSGRKAAESVHSRN
jgi:zeta-carotene desaturase